MTQDPTNGLSARVEPRKQTPTGNALNVQIGPGDPISNIPVVMEFEHHQVHEGETHRVQSAQASLGTGTVKYGITVPVFSPTVHAPHMVLAVSIYNGSAKVLFYEGATFTGGSPITAYNRNRNSATTPTTTITGGVTSTDGTLIETFYVGAGSKTAGSFRGDSEWVLKSNTIYRADLVGLVANTEAVLSFGWYEDLGV
jgi:hypothetical protein